MKHLIAAFLLLGAFVAHGQSVYPIRADTVKIYKAGGTAELVLQNATKDSLGLLINMGNGRTEFRKAKKLDDTHIIIGLDTFEVGTSSGTDSAIAALYGLKEDISGTTRYLYVDTFAIQSRARGKKIADSLVVVFNASLASKKDKSDSTASSGYLPVHRLADTAAVLRSLLTSGFDSASSQGGGFHTQPYNDARYKRNSDSTAQTGYVTHSQNDTAKLNFRNAIALKLDSVRRIPGKDSVYEYYNNGTQRFAYRDSIGTTGGGSIGGSIASTQVAYGSGSNTITGDSHTTINSSTHTLSADSLHAQVIQGDASAYTTLQYPFRFYSNYGGYSGMYLSNNSTSGSASTQLVITNGFGRTGFKFNVLGHSWPNAADIPVMRIFGSQPWVTAADSADWIYEQGTAGVSAYEWAHYWYNPDPAKFSFTIGQTLAYAPWYYNHNLPYLDALLYVHGPMKIKNTLTLDDGGGHAGTIKIGNYADSVGYVQGAGLDVIGINGSDTASFHNRVKIFGVDSAGKLYSPYYKLETSTASGFTTVALSGTGSNIQQKPIFDTTGNTRNNGNILFWNTASTTPTGSNRFTYTTASQLLNVAPGFGGGIITDSANLRLGILRLFDRGAGYTFIKQGTYLNGGSFVEPVGIKFNVLNATNPDLTALTVEGSGAIKIPVTPATGATGDAIMVWNSTAGELKKLSIGSGLSVSSGALTATGGGGSGVNRVSPIDSLSRVFDGLQVSGTNLVPNTADSTHNGMMDTASVHLLAKLGRGEVAGPALNVADRGTGGSQQYASDGTLYIRTIKVNGTAVDTLSDGTTNIVTGTSATYTSTLTNTTNITSSTFLTATYIKMGNVVQVRISVIVDPTAANTASALTFTLPFTTTATSQSVVGNGMCAVNGGNSYVGGTVGITSGTTGRLDFISGSLTTSSPTSIIFTYTL